VLVSLLLFLLVGGLLVDVIAATATGLLLKDVVDGTATFEDVMAANATGASHFQLSLALAEFRSWYE
jgi:hypothetical protein